MTNHPVAPAARRVTRLVFVEPLPPPAAEPSPKSPGSPVTDSPLTLAFVEPFVGVADGLG